MYVCLCNGFTEKDVRNAVGLGACSVAGVYKAMDCAPQCGKCGCDIKDMLEQERNLAVHFASMQNLAAE
ncbi:(2Fe-2S)-binding protein [Kiloniella laminariae]|uniref:(2Fe-2S)-binding protein n=1 Tax=Kiloniella laminariae TaxID=454162 RepID=UPI0003696FD8|nr:(2Fe-2S)-binding protein [Kiloniella laminariae]